MKLYVLGTAILCIVEAICCFEESSATWDARVIGASGSGRGDQQWEEDHFALLRPDSLQFYTDARKKCEWKPYIANTTCGAVLKETKYCKIDVTAPEGEGYFFIARIGSFTTTGGAQDIECELLGFPPDLQTFVTRNIVSAIEPYTEQFLGFPPIHLHHAFTRYRLLYHFPLKLCSKSRF